MLGLLFAALSVGLAFVWPMYDANLTALWWANVLMYWFGTFAVVEAVPIVGPLAFGFLAVRNAIMALSCYIVLHAYVDGVWDARSLVFAGILATLFIITRVFISNGKSSS